jgi:hypothetical protein
MWKNIQKEKNRKSEMGIKNSLKNWLGNTEDLNDVRPRLRILVIVVFVTIFGLFLFLIWESKNYSNLLMLVGIFLISLDKIFGRSWLVNKSAHYSGSGSKTEIGRSFWDLFLRYGLIEDYVGLIGTGIIIAVLFFEIFQALVPTTAAMPDRSMAWTYIWGHGVNACWLPSAIMQTTGAILGICIVIYVWALPRLEEVIGRTFSLGLEETKRIMQEEQGFVVDGEWDKIVFRSMGIAIKKVRGILSKTLGAVFVLGAVTIGVNTLWLKCLTTSQDMIFPKIELFSLGLFSLILIMFIFFGLRIIHLTEGGFITYTDLELKSIEEKPPQ